jgi:hypothetical protein
MTVPISADRYNAPLWLKLLITAGHLTAVAMMLYPFRGKTAGAWFLSIAVSIWAVLQVLVLGIWN